MVEETKIIFQRLHNIWLAIRWPIMVATPFFTFVLGRQMANSRQDRNKLKNIYCRLGVYLQNWLKVVKEGDLSNDNIREEPFKKMVENGSANELSQKIINEIQELETQLFSYRKMYLDASKDVYHIVHELNNKYAASQNKEKKDSFFDRCNENRRAYSLFAGAFIILNANDIKKRFTENKSKGIKLSKDFFFGEVDLSSPLKPESLVITLNEFVEKIYEKMEESETVQKVKLEQIELTKKLRKVINKMCKKQKHPTSLLNDIFGCFKSLV